MGVDLDLLPYTYDSDHGSSYSILACERRHKLWEAVEGLKEYEASEKFMSFRGTGRGGDSTFGITKETPYGETLRYTWVRELLSIRDHKDVQDNPVNRAIWAYLAELPPETKVALYWH